MVSGAFFVSKVSAKLISDYQINISICTFNDVIYQTIVLRQMSLLCGYQLNCFYKHNYVAIIEERKHSIFHQFCVKQQANITGFCI